MTIAPKAQVTILDSNIDVVESRINVYDDTVEYALYDYVQVNGDINRLYEATQAVPAGVYPPDDVNSITGVGTYWYDRGSTNYKRAFDELQSSACSNQDSIYYKFAISDTDVLMLSGLSGAASVRIVVTNNATGDIVLDRTDSLLTRDVYDWFDWTYAPVEFLQSYFTSLPLYYDSTLEIYLDNSGETVSVGHIAYGRGAFFGLTLADPKPTSSMRGITSKTRDDYGNIITRRKARYKRVKISCIFDSRNTDIFEERLNRLADTPAIFVGDDRDGGYRALLIFGELKDHDMPISLSKTTYALEIEGYL